MKSSWLAITFLLTMATVCALLTTAPVIAEEPEIPDYGSPVAGNDLFTYDPETGTITEKYDLLLDTANYSEIFTPPCNKWGCWRGAASLLEHDGTYYMAVRVRKPYEGDEFRGYRIEVYNSTNSREWSLCWAVNKTEIIGDTVHSFERVTLRQYDNLFYLYVAPDNTYEPGGWNSYCIKSKTISGLESELRNSSNWIEIGSYPFKCNNVLRIGDSYYALSGPGAHIHRSESPDGPFTLVAALLPHYIHEYGRPDIMAKGTILYDSGSGYFIFWGSFRHAGNIYWWWAVSTDLVNWESAGRRHIIRNWRRDDNYNTAKYMDYHAIDENHIVLTMDLDHNEKHSQGVFLWDYSGGEAIGNNSSDNILVDSNGVIIAGGVNTTKGNFWVEYSSWMYMAWGIVIGIIATCMCTIVAIKTIERRKKTII